MIFDIDKLTAREKLTKARVLLNERQPFYAYVTMKLEFIEQAEVGTIGVDQFGRCYYNPEWVDSITMEQLMGVLAHEVSHCLFDHIIRMKGKDLQLFNVCADAVINYMLLKNNFNLPKGVTPDMSSDTITIGQVTVEKLSTKIAERVYDEVQSGSKKQQQQSGQGQGDGQGDGQSGQSQQGFDKHIVAKKGKGKGDGKDKKDMKGKGQPNIEDRGKDYWEHTLTEAVTHAKLRGNMPRGMDRYFDKLLHPKLDWKQLLHKYVTESIPTDFTWLRPSKKSYSTGIYLPDTVKDGIELVVSIDTSGSINRQDLTKYMSEVNGIVEKMNGVTMTIIFHDTQVYGGETLVNATTTEVIEVLNKVKGGGGTDHRPVFDWIAKNKQDAKLLISFTDGYSRYPDRATIPTIFCVDKNGKTNIPIGKIIELN